MGIKSFFQNILRKNNNHEIFNQCKSEFELNSDGTKLIAKNLKELEVMILERKLQCHFIELSPEIKYLGDLFIKASNKGISLDGIGEWDVSNINDMSFLFCSCDVNVDISKWDVSNVEDMSYMFNNSTFNKDISNWNVSKVENMCGMFSSARFNKDISKWDVRNVKDMSGMFSYNKHFNGDISKWKVRNVEDMENMFYKSIFNQDISKWCVSKVKNMSHMFCKSKFSHDISRWNIRNVEDFSYMFAGIKCCPVDQWKWHEKIKNGANIYHMWEKFPFASPINDVVGFWSSKERW